MKRKMVITVDSDGSMDVVCKSGKVHGSLSFSNGSWVWNIYDSPTSQRSVAFGSNPTQYESYGELISEMFAMTT